MPTKLGSAVFDGGYVGSVGGPGRAAYHPERPVVVVSIMVLVGGDLHMFVSEHAVIIIFGGSIAATMIRFPRSAIIHGQPLGAKSAFT